MVQSSSNVTRQDKCIFNLCENIVRGYFFDGVFRLFLLARKTISLTIIPPWVGIHIN